jgi:hypothetical protein
MQLNGVNARGHWIVDCTLLIHMEMQDISLGTQVALLFILAIPVACVAWTVTHEEVFGELHQYCVDKSQKCRRLAQRKFFYALTCEFCFSHYVAALCLVVTRYRLVYESWRGYVVAWFSLVWIANVYMAIFGRLRLEIQSQRLTIEEEKRQLGEKD